MAAIAAAESSPDQAALTALMRRHTTSMLKYAQRLSGQPAQAEDLVQDTWLSVWQQAGRYDPAKAKVSTWLFRILHNRFVDWQRKYKRLSFFGLSHPELSHPHLGQLQTEQALSTQITEEEQPADSHDVSRAQFELAMGELPANQRAALLLKHANGMSNSEVAHVMGVGLRAVESLQARGRRSLRKSLRDNTT